MEQLTAAKQSLIDAEIARIKAGSHSGAFTFLHHEGPVVEKSHNIMEWVNCILTQKPAEERLTRLQHIYWVPPELYDDYQAKLKLLYAGNQAKWESLYGDHQAKLKSLDDEVLAIIPNCKWDGKTIFGK